MKTKLKHGLLLFSFFCISIISLKAEDIISWQNPLLHGNTLYSTSFVDATTGWAVGAFGTIMKTTDGGKTWENQISGTTASLLSVSFVDKNNGWAGGSNTILKTTDGGKSWTVLTTSSSVNINAVYFLNSTTGFIAGGKTIQKTIDGGKNFANVTMPSLSVWYSIIKMHFVSSKTGWAVGTSGAIFKTIDGGNTWVDQFTEDKRLNTVFFTDSLNGSCFGDSGFWIWTNDGGNKWNKADIKSTNITKLYNHVIDAHFFTKKSGWIITYDNSEEITVYKTIDGGAFWSEYNVGYSRNLSSISFPDSIHGCIVGHGGFIARTEDSGKNWIPISSGEIPPLISICFPDKSNGFVIGEQSAFMKTSDGGEAWEHSKVPNTGYINGVYALNKDTLLIANGMRDTTIFISTNGGKTWKGQYKAKFSYDIDFINKEQGTCVGWYGEIFRTNNLGKNWYKVESGTETDLYSIDFCDDDSVGYIVGDKGIYLKTANGGRNWNLGTTGTSTRLFSVSFADSLTGWCCGQGGVILHTDNGGKTWQAQTTNTYNSLNCIQFFNKNKGYCVGHYGTILKTTDGGKKWTVVPPVTVNNLFSVCFTDENTLFAAGWYGSILKIIDKEEVLVEEISKPESFFSLYPNPANNKINISNRKKESESLKIEVYDISGKKVLDRTIRNIINSDIDISELEKGYYLFKIQDNNYYEIKKILIN